MDLIATYDTAWKGFKKRIARVKTQKSRWKKQKKKEKKKGRRRWKSRANKKIPFEVKYKSKRLTSDSFGFESKSVAVKDKELFLFSKQNKFGMKKGIRMSEAAEHPLDKCCRVAYNFGRWYFLLPYEADAMKMDWPEQPRRVALDPGVRSFLSYYAEDGEMGDVADMQPRALKLDAKIRSIRDKIKELQTPPLLPSPISLEEKVRIAEEMRKRRKRVKKLRRAWYRSNARSSDLATDLHWKTIKYLLDRYDVIVAPRLNSASMLSGDSNLKETTKKVMRFQRHGAFHGRLLYKARCRRKVIVGLEEHGTSMTCSRCGNKKEDLGSSKVYRCHLCGLHADRDYNAAKNHLVKAGFGKTNY